MFENDIQYIKAVVWPHGPKEVKGNKRYRYVVVGMIITENPIEELEGKNEIVLDGPVFGQPSVSDIMMCAKMREPKIKLGDANDVLVGLGNI